MKRKVLTLVLAACLVATTFLASCGGNESSGGGSSAAAGGSAGASPAAEAPAQSDTGASEETATDEEVYNLRLIASWNPGNVNWPRTEIFKEWIEDKSGGRITVELVGGVDVFPADETGEAVSQGVVDIAYTSSGYMATYVPEIDVLACSNMTVQEQIDSGGYDYLNEILAGHNLYLVSSNDDLDATPFHIYMIDKVTSLADLKGKNIRTSPGFWNKIADGVGATAVPLALNETFTSLEQGLVDGFTAPSFIGSGEGFFEYAKYMIYPGVLRPGGCLVINTDTLAKLPADLQDILKNCAAELSQTWLTEYDNTITAPNVAALEEAGGEVVTLSEEEGAKLKLIADDAAWGAVAEKCPDSIDKLQELFRK
jgi:C4-dicarboxylate-binding protein DctP